MQYTDNIQLPSRGKYGKSHVKVARPTIGDLWEYLNVSGNNVIAKTAFVQSLCDTDLSGYPVGDRDFVFVNIRNMVSEPVISGNFECTNDKCEDIVVYRFDTRKAKVHQLPNDFQADYNLVFPVSKSEKVINVLTVKQEELLEEYLGLYESVEDTKLPNSALGEDLYTFARYACMFKDSIDPDMVDENVTYLRGLDFEDFKLLMLYDVSFKCGPELVVDAQCDTCKKKYRVRLKDDSSFFGLNLSSLLNKHRFLARVSNIGFEDFLKYNLSSMETVVKSEITRVEEKNRKVRSQIKNRR